MQLFKNKKIVWPVVRRNLIILALIGYIIFDFNLSINKKEINTKYIKYKSTYIEYEEYIISPGKTLWSIALENKPENMDVREYVYLIEKDNGGIEAGNLKVGQIIKIRR
ncbi:MAG: LysM domain-containing protein [Clostridia bacterium]